jgi:hypothetical protein
MCQGTNLKSTTPGRSPYSRGQEPERSVHAVGAPTLLSLGVTLDSDGTCSIRNTAPQLAPFFWYVCEEQAKHTLKRQPHALRVIPGQSLWI